MVRSRFAMSDISLKICVMGTCTDLRGPLSRRSRWSDGSGERENPRALAGRCAVAGSLARLAGVESPHPRATRLDSIGASDGADAVPAVDCSRSSIPSAGWRARAAPRFHAFTASAPVWKIWEGDGIGGKGAFWPLSLNAASNASAASILISSHNIRQRLRGSSRGAADLELREVVSRLDASVPALVAGDFNTDSRRVSLLQLSPRSGRI